MMCDESILEIVTIKRTTYDNLKKAFRILKAIERGMSPNYEVFNLESMGLGRKGEITIIKMKDGNDKLRQALTDYCRKNLQLEEDAKNAISGMDMVNKKNIELRKANEDLKNEISTLNSELNHLEKLKERSFWQKLFS